jgi:hypothetical protein
MGVWCVCVYYVFVLSCCDRLIPNKESCRLSKNDQETVVKRVFHGYPYAPKGVTGKKCGKGKVDHLLN